MLNPPPKLLPANADWMVVSALGEMTAVAASAEAAITKVIAKQLRKAILRVIGLCHGFTKWNGVVKHFDIRTLKGLVSLINVSGVNLLYDGFRSALTLVLHGLMVARPKIDFQCGKMGAFTY